jgi:O-antigen/teichoic acid export membrane protein
LASPLQSLTSGRLLARNTIWNFIGLAAPLFVGLVAMPLLIQGMGKERFGMLTIIWMGVGYFSLFDMGLGRALTKLVAERLGNGRSQELGELIWTALWLITGLGVFGALILLSFTGPLIYYVLNVPPELQQEAIAAFRILAGGIPFVILSSALVGLLAAHQRFGMITLIRIPLGILTFMGPLATVQFSPSLVWATLAMLFARIIACCVYFFIAASLRKELARPQWPHKPHVKPLFFFGGWLTLSNIIGPFMVYFDRFLLGSVLTMTAVTYYVTPYEVLSRMQRLPMAVVGVLFPAMSSAYAADRPRLVYLYERTSRVLVILMLPVMSFCFLFAPEVLEIWLGPQFRNESTIVVQWLAVGWIVNIMAQAPFTVLQSSGRPDLVAKAHTVELLPYMLLLWFMTNHFGIAGTAAAWVIRVLLDTILLNELARQTIPELGGVIKRTYIELAGVIMGAVMFAGITSVAMRIMVFFVLTVLVMVPALWYGKRLLKSPSTKTEIHL